MRELHTRRPEILPDLCAWDDNRGRVARYLLQLELRVCDTIKIDLSDNSFFVYLNFLSLMLLQAIINYPWEVGLYWLYFTVFQLFL